MRKHKQPKYITTPLDRKLSKLVKERPRHLPYFMIDWLINANPDELHVSALKNIISILGRHLIKQNETLDEKVWTFLRKISHEDNPILSVEARSWIENYDAKLRAYEKRSASKLAKLFYKAFPAYKPIDKAQVARRNYQELIPNAELEGN